MQENAREELVGWKSCTFDGCFSIDLPAEANMTLEDGDSMAIFTLPTMPPTSVFAGVFPTPSGQSLTEVLLRKELGRFMVECAHCDNPNVQIPVDVGEDDLLTLQGIGAARSDGCLIARAYGWPGGREFLLIHCSGQANLIKEVALPVMVSVKVLLPKV